MAIVKISVTLQSASDVDTLLAKHGATVQPKGAKGYDIDTVGGVLKLVSWDTDLGPTPTQQDIDSLQPADKTAGQQAIAAVAYKAAATEKDRQADFALMHRAVDAAKWDGLTTQAQVAAVQADAGIWLAFRQLLDLP